MKSILMFLKRQKLKLLLVFIITVIQCIGTLYIPFLIADIIDRGIAQLDMGVIAMIGLEMLVVAAAVALVSVIGSYLCADVAATLGTDLRTALFAKTQALSIKEFNHFGTSSLIARTTGDIVNIQQTVMMFLQMILPAPIICVASIVMTALINPILCWIPICSLAIFMVIAVIIIGRANPISQEMRTKMDSIIQVSRESIVGVRVIRAFDNAQYEQGRTDIVFTAYADACIKINKLFAYFNPCVWTVMGAAMAAVLWFGGNFVLSGGIEVGKITAITEYTIMSLMYLIMATMATTMIPKMSACIRRIREVISTETEINDAEVLPSTATNIGDNASADIAASSHASDSSIAIEFKNVEFKYKGAEEAILQNVNFACKKGETTAIIGGTGSGKSTIASLILRLHDIQSGQISVEGNDIRSISQRDLRERIAYIPQKAFLFSGTLAENLRYGKPSARVDELMESARIAQALEFIDSLELKFDSPVAQGGSNFSGGQKQRLCIARALVKKAPICIFDDSFSALDLRTDAALRRAIKREMEGTTIILIAQRISTILDAEQILVVDAGRIVGAGTHRELIATCEEYKKIAASQLTEEEAAAYDSSQQQ